MLTNMSSIITIHVCSLSEYAAFFHPRELPYMSLATVLEEIGRRRGTSEMIPIFDPSTATQIGEFADGGAPTVDAAVARARATFNSGVWHGKTTSERTRILWRVAELIEQIGRAHV